MRKENPSSSIWKLFTLTAPLTMTPPSHWTPWWIHVMAVFVPWEENLPFEKIHTNDSTSRFLLCLMREFLKLWLFSLKTLILIWLPPFLSGALCQSPPLLFLSLTVCVCVCLCSCLCLLSVSLTVTCSFTLWSTASISSSLSQRKGWSHLCDANPIKTEPTPPQKKWNQV